MIFLKDFLWTSPIFSPVIVPDLFFFVKPLWTIIWIIQKIKQNRIHHSSNKPRIKPFFFLRAFPLGLATVDHLPRFQPTPSIHHPSAHPVSLHPWTFSVVFFFSSSLPVPYSESFVQCIHYASSACVMSSNYFSETLNLSCPLIYFWAYYRPRQSHLPLLAVLL